MATMLSQYSSTPRLKAAVALPLMLMVVILKAHDMPQAAAAGCNASFTVEDAQRQGLCFWQNGNLEDELLLPQLQQCLHGKKIFIIGTSVSRNWYFQLLNLMQASSHTPWQRGPTSKTYREEQKKLCGGGTERSRESCKQDNIVFRWQNQDLFDTSLARTLASGYDIIVANMGLGNIVHRSRHWQGHLLTHGQLLAEAVAQLPSSTRFYWRTTTHICPNERCQVDTSKDGDVTMKGCGVPDDANAMIDIHNLVLPRILLREDPRVQVLDVLPLTACSLYDDHVHHANLTTDHILLLAGRECPQLADSIIAACPQLCSLFTSHSNPQQVIG